MQTSKRAFFIQLGLTGLSLLSWPRMLKAGKKKSNALKTKNWKGLTVLFQGDSITDGGRSRNQDWNHIMGHGYAYLVSSREAPANYWVWDGVHPMPAGHELMARVWINEVSKKLDFIGK